MAGSDVLMNAPASHAHLHKSQLCPEYARFVETLVSLNFGRCSNLTVRGGKPVYGPDTTIVRTVKLGGRNAPRPEWSGGDFILRPAHRELLDLMRRLGDFVIRRLEVANGLPLLVEVEEPGALTPPQGA